MELAIGGYDLIAGEYYDAVLHPTCADFRDATRLLLDPFLDETAVAGKSALELGAGKSLVAECYRAHGLPLDTLMLTDQSSRMLAYSQPWEQWGATMRVASLETFDPVGGRFELGFACLGDPFNGALLWRRIAEFLLPGGVWFYTTPAFAWTSRFRERYQSGLGDVAEFLVGGESVTVPSVVLPEPAQRSLIEAAGLSLAAVRHVARRDLQSGARSPKIRLNEIADDLPIVTAYIAHKPTSAR